MDVHISFPDRQCLLEYVADVLRVEGFFSSIAKSRQGKVWIKCDLGGSYQSSGGQRHTGTRLIQCPFQVVARLFKKENVWKITSIFNEHNHQLSHKCNMSHY